MERRDTRNDTAVSQHRLASAGHTSPHARCASPSASVQRPVTTKMSDSQLAFFLENGFVIVSRALDADTVARLTEVDDRVCDGVRAKKGLAEHKEVSTLRAGMESALAHPTGATTLGPAEEQEMSIEAMAARVRELEQQFECWREYSARRQPSPPPSQPVTSRIRGRLSPAVSPSCEPERRGQQQQLQHCRVSQRRGVLQGRRVASSACTQRTGSVGRHDLLHAAKSDLRDTRARALL